MANKYLIPGAVIAAGIGAYIILNKKKTENFDYPVIDVPVVDLPEPTVPTINQHKILQKGMQGAEVAELQRLLGIYGDGVFGAQTEAALLAKKGVKSITLASYNSTATVNANPLKIGDRVMSYKKPGTAVTKVQALANSTYHDTGVVHGTISFGSEIGKIVAISTPSRSHYVVEVNGFLSNSLVWVKATDVVKY